MNIYLEYNEYDKELVNKLAAGDTPKNPDPAEGISTCDQCGARYQGKYTDKCINVIPFIMEKDYSWSRVALPKVIRDVIYNKKNGYGYSRAEYALQNGKLTYDKCDHDGFTWSLHNEKDTYDQFINFLRSVSVIESDYSKFNKYLTKQANDAIINSLPDRILALEEHQFKVNQAIRTIIDKMNSAGHYLSF